MRSPSRCGTHRTAGAVVTDLDGTAVHKDAGRIVIPPDVDGGLDRRRVPALRDALLALDADALPRLAHGDARLKNVIVDERGALVALIDWDECRSVPAPHWDLAIALHDLSIDEKHAFVEGYGLAPGTLRELAPADRALNLLHYAPWVERAAADGDAAQLAQLQLRLAGVYELYGA